MCVTTFTAVTYLSGISTEIRNMHVTNLLYVYMCGYCLLPFLCLIYLVIEKSK